MFVLVADVLQQLIKSSQGLIRHPLVDDAPCPVLQYADDTLIVVRGDLHDIQNLKVVLDRFALAKSTAVPTHMAQESAAQCVNALGCSLQCFPQTYLGLPLSVYKLPSSAFSPTIAKADRYLGCV
jgi:hypothetical protein